MAITQAVANSFKKELLEGVHKFQYTSGDVFKLAFFSGIHIYGAWLPACPLA